MKIDLKKLPDDPILDLLQSFKKDPRPQKLNLSAGVLEKYRELWIFPVIRKAAQQLSNSALDTAYLPIEGSSWLHRAMAQKILGSTFSEEIFSSIGILTTAGGTQALNLACQFVSQLSTNTLYLPESTWPNHPLIADRAQLLTPRFPYLNAQSNALEEDHLLAFLKKESHQAILLHAVCHNPSGIDPSEKLWDKILSLIQEREHLLLLDLAYLGLGRGWDQDAYVIKSCLRQKIPFLCALSFSKNFCLYGERTGMLWWYHPDEKILEPSFSHLKRIQRSTISNPPRYGSDILTKVLAQSDLWGEFQQELEEARLHLLDLRRSLIAQLPATKRFETLRHSLESGSGLFAMTGLQPSEVAHLQKEHAIFMPSSGRISISALDDRACTQLIDSMSLLDR